jgi:hypothetical protein
MIVFAIPRDDENGKVLFQGTMKECEDYTKELRDFSNFYSINICKENGEIEKRILRPQQAI